MVHRIRIKGGVLSTVIVVAVLMLLMVFAVIALWDADFLLFSRSNYLRIQRANIESSFTLYRNYPEVIEHLDADSTIVLFDSIPGSRMKMMRKPWGLYEVVTVESGDGNMFRCAVLGLRQPYKDDCVLWYSNNDGAVTLTGKSHLGGTAYLPDNGIIYGRMQSAFFEGVRLSPNRIRQSDKQLPIPSEAASKAIDGLFGLKQVAGMEQQDSMVVSFRDSEPEILIGERISDSYLSGQIIITGNKINIGSDAELHDIIIVADEIRIDDDFRGSVQLFAKDSVIVGRNVVLESPSGVYSEKYAEIGDGSEVNGYLIIDYADKEDIMRPACRKSRLSKLRGLFYCSGIAELQGIVSGSVFIEKSVYYSPQGYYVDFLYDVAILDNSNAAWPLWFDGSPKRKEEKWVY